MVRLPLTPKVGEVPPDVDKFASWSGPFGYYPRAATATPQFKTDRMLNDTFNIEDLIINRTVCSRLSNKNKSLVEYKSTSAENLDQRLLSRSNSVETHVFHKHYLELLSQPDRTEQFRHSFLKYQRNEKDCVSFYEIDLVVKDCLGNDAPEFIIGKFKEFGSSLTVRGEIFWKDFCAVLEKVIKSVQAECAYHKELPPLVALMTRPRIVDKNIEALGDMSTIYRDTFNRVDEIKFREDTPDFQFRKPVEQSTKLMDSAAKVLYAGTTKMTHHVPGYRGHIPENLRNRRKFEHASGQAPHPVENHLRLTQRGMGCMLGYTGYVPMEPIGNHTERKTSCDPRTSNGAAFSGTRVFL